MRLRMDREGHYIRAVIENNDHEAVVRRWPWPNDDRGREVKFNEASEYVNRLAAVLACPVEL